VAVILRKKFKILNYFKIFSETSFFLILWAQNARNFPSTGEQKHKISQQQKFFFTHSPTFG
jgi:hypothetical protein